MTINYTLESNILTIGGKKFDTTGFDVKALIATYEVALVGRPNAEELVAASIGSLCKAIVTTAHSAANEILAKANASLSSDETYLKHRLALKKEVDGAAALTTPYLATLGAVSMKPKTSDTEKRWHIFFKQLDASKVTEGETFVAVKGGLLRTLAEVPASFAETFDKVVSIRQTSDGYAEQYARKMGVDATVALFTDDNGIVKVKDSKPAVSGTKGGSAEGAVKMNGGTVSVKGEKFTGKSAEVREWLRSKGIDCKAFEQYPAVLWKGGKGYEVVGREQVK